MIALFPELLNLVKSEEFEKLSIAVRKYFAPEDAKSPRANILAMMMRIGVQVEKAQLKNFGTIAASDQGGNFRVVVVYKNSGNPIEDRFLLAHMMGHLFFDIQPLIATGDFGKGGFKEDLHPAERYSQSSVLSVASEPLLRSEELADEFAAALLMPKAMFLHAYTKLNDLNKTAHFFAVKPEWVGKRFESLQQANSGSKESTVQPKITIKPSRAGASAIVPANTQLKHEIEPLTGMARLRKLASLLEKPAQK